MGSQLTSLRVAVAALAEADPSLLRPAELAEQVTELRRLIDGLEGVWSELVAVLDGSGSIEGGTASWLRAACRLSPGAARSRVVLARRLAERPEVLTALRSGAISVDHARVVTTALGELAGAAGEPLAADTEVPLVSAARQVDPARLRREIAHARHALVPEAAADADQRAFDRRHLDVATTFAGAVVVSGVLDPEGGEALLTALAPLARRSGPDDTRTPGQRRADALVQLCHRGLDPGALLELGGERPHLTVVVPVTALAAAVPVPASSLPVDGAPVPSSCPVRAGRTGADVGQGRVTAETTWGAVLGGSAVRRLACDASLVRVVLDADSQPLDVGRRSRTVPAAIRTALVVRDGGCVFPGCDRPPPWTDAHHVLHWADGGPTSLDNLILLCRRHHRTVHEGHWQILRDPDGHWTITRAA
jgi:hypothetical protein